MDDHEDSGEYGYTGAGIDVDDILKSNFGLNAITITHSFPNIPLAPSTVSIPTEVKHQVLIGKHTPYQQVRC